jgi:hypothetical protein
VIKLQDFGSCTRLARLWAKILRPYCVCYYSDFFEEKINMYRLWNLNIDGYDICFFYTESQMGEFVVKSVQIFAKKSLNLPFLIVLKIGNSLLGSSEKNIFFSYIKSGNTVFCWTKVENKNGEDSPLNEEEIHIKNFLSHKFAYIPQ